MFGDFVGGFVIVDEYVGIVFWVGGGGNDVYQFDVVCGQCCDQVVVFGYWCGQYQFGQM